MAGGSGAPFRFSFAAGRGVSRSYISAIDHFVCKTRGVAMGNSPSADRSVELFLSRCESGVAIIGG